MNIKKLTIGELETFYNLTQIIIDNTVLYGKMNMHSMVTNDKVQRDLNLYNRYRDKIINEIKERLDETFS